MNEIPENLKSGRNKYFTKEPNIDVIVVPDEASEVHKSK